MATKRSEQLQFFQRQLGIVFKDISLLNMALTHRSYANECKKKVADNERLEFLGDAVLGLIISDYLLKRYHQASEGGLSKLKGYIVSESVLSMVARKISLGNYLLLGTGEKQRGGQNKSSLLANTLEGVIGAIFLDQGLSLTTKIVLSWFQPEIEKAVNSGIVSDYKGLIQEYTQAKFSCLPTYQLIAATGAEHEKVFEISLSIKGKVHGCGKGRSKKEAEQNAAKQAWANLLQQEENLQTTGFIS